MKISNLYRGIPISLMEIHLIISYSCLKGTAANSFNYLACTHTHTRIHTHTHTHLYTHTYTLAYTHKLIYAYTPSPRAIAVLKPWNSGLWAHSTSATVEQRGSGEMRGVEGRSVRSNWPYQSYHRWTECKLLRQNCMQDFANKTHTEKQNLNVIRYQNEHETYQADKQMPYTGLPPPLLP